MLDVPARGLVHPEDEVFDPEEADPVGAGCSSPFGGLGKRDVHLDERACDDGCRCSHRRGCRCCRRSRNCSFVDGTLLPIDGDDLPVL